MNYLLNLTKTNNNNNAGITSGIRYEHLGLLKNGCAVFVGSLLALGGLWVLLNQSLAPQFGMNGFLKIILILFIYFFAVQGLRSWKAFSSCANGGLLSSGFSLLRLLFLWGSGSRVQGLSCSVAWDLPRLGIETASLALAGRFFTTELLGKPLEGMDFI